MTTVAQELRINEEYAILVPKISDSWYEHIKEQIKTNGQHVPIVINRKGEILDGLTRNRICKELGIEPRRILCPEKYEDPLLAKQFVISINRDRRHLNDFQLVELYYKLFQYETEIEAKKRQLAGTRPTSVSYDTKADTSQGFNKEFLQKIETEVSGLTPSQSKPEKEYDSEELSYISSSENKADKGRTREIIAKKSGLAPATYSRIVKIIEKAPEEVKEKLRQGKARIYKEYKKLQYKEKKEQLKAQNCAVDLPEGFRLVHGDFREVCKELANDSIDLILTDPPYNRQGLPLYGDLAKVAERVLKPNGSLVAYAGNYYLPEILDYLRQAQGLKYVDQFIVKHGGSSIRSPVSNLREKYKALWWFVKSESPNPIMSGLTHDNLIERSPPPDKSLHEW